MIFAETGKCSRLFHSELSGTVFTYIVRNRIKFLVIGFLSGGFLGIKLIFYKKVVISDDNKKMQKNFIHMKFFERKISSADVQEL